MVERRPQQKKRVLLLRPGERLMSERRSRKVRGMLAWHPVLHFEMMLGVLFELSRTGGSG